jgi:two-component sensor histidine kinase
MNGTQGYRKCITVKIETIPGGDIVLSVGDNGVGLPGEIDVETSATLGMRLVGILTKQINGTLTIDRDGGTLFTIFIPHR